MTDKLAKMCETLRVTVTAYERALADLREYFAENIESLSYIRFEHIVRGRVHTGDLEVKFLVGDNSYGGICVEGTDPYRMMTEFLHRLGYDQTVIPKCLPRPSNVVEPTLEDDIQF